MTYPNKPHLKILASFFLILSQYYLLNTHFGIEGDKNYEIATFVTLTINTLVGSVVIGSTTYDIKKQLQSEIQNDIKIIQNEAIYLEKQLEKFEHVILNDATLLLGSKVYRPNPILGRFD